MSAEGAKLSGVSPGLLLLINLTDASAFRDEDCEWIGTLENLWNMLDTCVEECRRCKADQEDLLISQAKGRRKILFVNTYVWQESIFELFHMTRG